MIGTAIRKEEKQPEWGFAYLLGCFLVLLLAGASAWGILWRGEGIPAAVFVIESVALALVVGVLIAGLVRKKISYVWWEALVWALGFAGIWVLSIAALPSWVGLPLAGLLTVLAYLWPMTLIVALCALMGATGIGLMAALHFPFSVMLVSVLGVALHEAFRSKESGVALLFAEAQKAGIAPGIVLPADLADLGRPVTDVWAPGRGVVVGILPFAALAAMGIHLASYAFHSGPVGYMVYAVFSAATIAAGWIGFRRPRLPLATWPALAGGILGYLVYGIVRYLMV